jgi:uncharacterized membrane protein
VSSTATRDTAEPDEDEVPSQVGVGIEHAISYSLRGGVLVAFMLVAIGIALGFVDGTFAGGKQHLDKLTAPQSPVPHTLAAVLTGVVDGQANAWIAVGLVVLVITPILRVAVSIVGFARLRDHTYTVITSIVLALLVISFFVGGAS